MMRRLIAWLDRKFPEKTPEGWHEAEEPWIVVITISNDDGSHSKEILHYDEDYMYRLFYEESWRRASFYAKERATQIRKKGVRIKEDDGLETHYPVHRIHVVEAMINPYVLGEYDDE